MVEHVAVGRTGDAVEDAGHTTEANIQEEAAVGPHQAASLESK